MRSGYKPIGEFIKLIDERNIGLKVENLVGLTINKDFIPSVANTIGSDMANYKVIRKGYFACSLMQVRRDKKIPVALMTEFDEAIISQAYPVFKINRKEELLPEYLMMWMRRSEFDREACFYAVGGVRGSLEWEDFCNMKLPVPHIDKQREIVKEYNTIVNRISLNEELNRKLEETAQAIYKQWFVDFEFPVSKDYAAEISKPELEGKPYKSSGGEMVWNEELGKEIPAGWRNCSFTDAIDIRGGGTPHTENSSFWNGLIPFFTPGDTGSSFYSTKTEKSITQLGFEKSSTKLYSKNTVFITARGTVGKVSMASKTMAMNQSCYAAIGKEHSQFFVHLHSIETLLQLRNEANGGVFGALVTTDFTSQAIVLPPILITKYFSERVKYIYNFILEKQCESDLLNTLLNILLSKITKVGA